MPKSLSSKLLQKTKITVRRYKVSLSIEEDCVKPYLRVRTAVRCAITYRKAMNCSQEEKIKQLYNRDILNGPKHIFGDHSLCKERAYFFKRDTGDTNYVPNMTSSLIMSRIMQHVWLLASDARSLIHDVDSNTVECYNNAVAKFFDGKRIHYSLKRSYNGRCAAAVVAFNTNRPHCTLHKFATGNSPEKLIKQLELKRLQKNNQQVLSKKKRK